MVGLICRLFDLLAPLVRLAGADYGQFRTILETKLRLDNRRHSLGLGTRRAKPRNTFAASLAIFALMGLFMIPAVVMAASPFTALTVVHSFVMVVIGVSLISDFTGVLMDTTDLSVLGPRPVSGRTILVARLAHIGTYLAMLALALSAATLVAGMVVYAGWFGPVFVATLVGSVILVVFVVNVFYLAALRFTDVERFKDVIVYFQVGMTVLLVAGYQLLPRLVDFKDLGQVGLAGRWWNHVYPACWFAAPAELVAGRSTLQMWLLTAQAAVLPLIGLVIVARYLAPQFGQSLLRLGSDVSGSAGGGGRSPSRMREVIGRCVARSAEQRFGFDLVWAMIARDRGYKQRVYPQIAFVFVWPLVMLFVADAGPAAVLADLDQPWYYLPPLYFAAFFLPAMLFQLGHSTQFEAAWIYYALPLTRPGEVMVGALKALACRLAIPAFAVLAVMLVGLGGLRLVPDVLLALGVNGCVGTLCGMGLGRDLPFSSNVTAAQSGGRIGWAVVMLIPPAAAGGVHYLLTRVPYAVTVAILPTAALGAVLLRVYARLGGRSGGLQL